MIGKGDQQTFINALDRQGKVHVITNPQVVTMNNQMASIRITNDTSYVKSVSTTQTPDAGLLRQLPRERLRMVLLYMCCLRFKVIKFLCN